MVALPYTESARRASVTVLRGCAGAWGAGRTRCTIRIGTSYVPVTVLISEDETIFGLRKNLSSTCAPCSAAARLRSVPTLSNAKRSSRPGIAVLRRSSRTRWTTIVDDMIAVVVDAIPAYLHRGRSDAPRARRPGSIGVAIS